MKVSKVLGRVGAAASVVSSVYYSVLSKALAQSPSEFLGGINQTAGGGSLIDFIQDALNLVIALAALVAVGILVYSGIQYILASGDEGKIEKATKGITYAIVGLVICFISVLIVNFVLSRLLQV